MGNSVSSCGCICVWEPGPPSSRQNSVSGVMSKSTCGGSPEVQVRGAIVFPPFCVWTHVFCLGGTRRHAAGHRFSIRGTVEGRVLCPPRASSKVMLQLHLPQNDGFYRPARQAGAAGAGSGGSRRSSFPTMFIFLFYSKIPFKC